MTTADDVRLRPMRWWDIEAVADLERRLFPHDAWSPEAFWGELAQRETRQYLVAERGGALAGYAGLLVGPGEADVLTLAVAPEAQGGGLGRTLLGELLDRATAEGCSTVLLEVRADNEPALGLYTRAGFERAGVRRRYYADGADALLLRRQGGAE